MNSATITPRSPHHVPLVELTRGDIVESIHFGSFAVVDRDGSTVLSAGEPETPIYARSSLKPLQSIAMVRAGLDLPDDLQSLGSASHSGAQMHLDGVVRILDMHGLDLSALRNVEDGPVGVSEREAWLRANGEKSRHYMNCSGKHAAMLATCVVNGWSTEDYLDAAHPLQVQVKAVCEELTEETSAADTTDGCGTPLFAFSITGLARAFAKIGAAEEGTAEARVFNAISRYPEMLGGEGREVTDLMRAVPNFIVKDGAECVFAGALRDGIGLVGKISDGNPRALLSLGKGMLGALGVSTEALEALTPPPVLGGGKPVGEMRPVATTFAR